MAEVLQLVGFHLGHEEFGVDIAGVQEIVRMREITQVPRAPEFVEGVVNLRGKIIPVLDLRKRFRLPASEETKNTRIVVATVAGRTVGIIVDAVSEVLRVDASAIDPTPEMVASRIDSTFLTGIAMLEGRLLIMLDLDRILSPQEAERLAV